MELTSRRYRRALGAIALSLLSVSTGGAASGAGADRYITVASTTSTENSGLFGHVLPVFERRTGIAVRVVALGTGQALDVGRRGDADVVFVHDRAAEERFVAEGAGIGRRDVMYNDYVLIGPEADPAQVSGGHDITVALRAIRDARAPFVSRGDRSGTHAAELRLWSDAGIVSTVGDVKKFVRALVDGDLFRGPATFDAMTRLPNGVEMGYGQGIGISRKGGDTILFHTGGAASWWTHHTKANLTFVGTMNDATDGADHGSARSMRGSRRP
jgi:hypothetical protein